MRLYALDSVDIEPLRADLMARLEHHRDRCARYERILGKRFPEGTASPPISASCWRFASAFATSAPWWNGARRRSRPCRPLSAGADRGNVVSIEDGQRENNG